MPYRRAADLKWLKNYFMCVLGYMGICMYMWTSENNLGGQVLSFYHVILGIKLRSFRLGSKNLYPRNHLADPKTYHLNKIGKTTAVTMLPYCLLVSPPAPPPRLSLGVSSKC